MQREALAPFPVPHLPAHWIPLAAAAGAACCLLVAGCNTTGLSTFGIAIDLGQTFTPPDLVPPPPTCGDRTLNGRETDSDCGGPDCAPCATGRACLMRSDCQSGLCDGQKLMCVSCTDNLRDGQESGVDCGGPDCPACEVGGTCADDHDCVSLACRKGVCGSPGSCAAIKAARPDAVDGTYMIDPDADGAAPPFNVWCDMTFDKGGWTALPLRFTDPAFWSITHSGTDCTSAPATTKNGSLLSFQNAAGPKWSYLSMKFVPPIPVKQVWFYGLTHSTATACNNMDLLYTVTPASTGDETAESWYFSGEDPTIPLGYTFAAGCNSPSYSGFGGMTPECSMQTSDNTVQITRVIDLAKQAPAFRMVAVQGCGSSVCNANTGQAERFYINHPPEKNGNLWKDGILVR